MIKSVDVYNFDVKSRLNSCLGPIHLIFQRCIFVPFVKVVSLDDSMRFFSCVM